MRVTRVEINSANLNEQPITFSLQDSDPTSKYVVRTILGLDAEEIIPKFYGVGLNTGSKYYDFSLKPRDIVMRVVLNPNFRIDESYSDVRDELYRVISPNRTGLVTLHFHSGATLVSTIKGSIIKFEVPYFVKLPEVQLTIRCNDPMFKAFIPTVLIASEIEASNPIDIPDSLSTSPHGFTMQFIFNTAADDFTIQDVEIDPEWKFKVVPDGGFEVGDILYFSSEYANKYLYIDRSDVIIELIDKIEPGSIWPILFPGPNPFTFVDIDKIDWGSVQFYASYWGV